ncbi:Crp/Fnr family transcriptional regulator [Maribacter sp. MJ134]|uniref:Crp/Fnr family transcriptional regulator n=1 Tax=Maribacter sp. MJ134 TaxID=2496865 RepID=UPI000F839CA3|nr:Crp/Fnr family transcriptional regulator [Maribacter sp. MJ134]AZQ60405.1 Crp/Fnr family transcriptional regulator [Maribacter sp. MJ134]
MDRKKIVEIISNHYSPLTPECKLDLITNSKLLVLQKGTVLVRGGQFSDKTFFIVNGCARAYYLKDGKDISDWFAFENEFISSINSFFLNIPSPHFIELIEDSVLLEISRGNIEILSNTYHDFERLSKVVAIKTMLKQQERITSMQFHSAEEKYKNLLSIHPDINQRIPLTHIASYINITLETLSRIRKRLTRI